MTRRKRTVKIIILGIIGSVILFIAVIIVNFIIVGKIGAIISTGEPIADNGKNNCALLVI